MKSNIDIRSLEIFTTVAQSGSLTSASNILNITVSAISQTLSDMEGSLDTILVDRTKRPFVITPSGKILQKEAEAILKKIDSVLSQTMQANNLPLRQINVEMSESLLALISPPILKNMKDITENWRFSGTNSPDIYEKIKKQEIDVGIMDNYSVPLESPYAINTIIQEPYIVAVPKSYADKHKNITIESLVSSELTFVRYALNTTTGQRIESYIMQQKQNIPKGMEFDSAPAQMAMVKSGIGWGITTPICYLQNESNNNDVVLVPLKITGFHRTIVMVSQSYLSDDISVKMADVSKSTIKKKVEKLYDKYPWLKKDISIK